MLNMDEDKLEFRKITATLHYCEVMAERIESQWEKSPLKRENIAKIILAIEWAVLIILQIVALIVGWR